MPTRVAKVILFSTILVLVAASVNCGTPGNPPPPPPSRRLANLEITKHNYDIVHEQAILDQIDNYIAPPRITAATTRQQSFEGLYEFCLDPQVEGFKEEWFASELNTRCHLGNLYKMPVPSAFNDIVPNTTVRNYMGWFWYQTTIDARLLMASGAPKPEANSTTTTNTIYLQFDNINYMAMVWLSPSAASVGARMLGSHVGGHLPLVIEVDDITIGWLRSGSCRLTIAVSNLLTRDTIPSGEMVDLSQLVGREYRQFRPDFDFFHFAGIMGQVRLLVVQNGGDSPSTSSNELPTSSSDNMASKFKQMITNRTQRQQQRLRGFGMHHEQLFSGRTMSLAAIMKDLYLVKDVGANLIRTSHYPYSEAYLEACDQLNLMVVAECPAVGLNSFSELKLKLHKQILLEMMQRDHHHGSIVAWSLANEPQSQLAEARPYFESLFHYARTNLSKFTVEAQRPLTAAIAQSHRDDKIGHLLDVLMINRYYGWYDYMGALEAIRPALLASLQGWTKLYPSKPILVSEFGAEALAGLHRSTRQLFSEEYQRDLIDEYEQIFEYLATRGPNVTGVNFLGSMIWNFADFTTHDSLERAGGNRKGILTQTREPKLAYELVKGHYKSRAASAGGTCSRRAGCCSVSPGA